MYFSCSKEQKEMVAPLTTVPYRWTHHFLSSELFQLLPSSDTMSDSSQESSASVLRERALFSARNTCPSLDSRVSTGTIEVTNNEFLRETAREPRKRRRKSTSKSRSRLSSTRSSKGSQSHSITCYRSHSRSPSTSPPNKESGSCRQCVYVASFKISWSQEMDGTRPFFILS